MSIVERREELRVGVVHPLLRKNVGDESLQLRLDLAIYH